ncbi:aminoglycoside phosphotransferase family protein [Streptomyces sp. NPDC047079]|uniref:aminoglycoside phosphotransferase family protein n=1 Tax=Streptomyces sp. NPDC047079 TaxID=3154607 RepID=UPI0033E0DC2A
MFRCFKRDTDTSAWLKITPEPGTAREEAEALRAWAKTPSVVTLLAQDLAAGALLLDDVEPGVQVRQRARKLAEVAALLRELRVSPPAPGEHSVLRPLSHRVDFLFDLTDRRLAAADMNDLAASAVLRRARAAALELATDGPVGLVHGDQHPANVLSGPDARMVAIDPRPTWGDPDFDAVDWVLEGAADLTVWSGGSRSWRRWFPASLLIVCWVGAEPWPPSPRSPECARGGTTRRPSSSWPWPAVDPPGGFSRSLLPPCLSAAVSSFSRGSTVSGDAGGCSCRGSRVPGRRRAGAWRTS